MESHPEQLPGEVYLGNMTEESYDQCGWGTKRRGSAAYDRDGRLIWSTNELFPVFAQKSELSEAGVHL